MSDRFDRVKTNDTGMAAYLRLRGHMPLDVTWDEEKETVFWLFDEDAAEDATLFLNNDALVNPKEYSHAYGKAKRELYQVRPENPQL